MLPRLRDANSFRYEKYHFPGVVRAKKISEDLSTWQALQASSNDVQKENNKWDSHQEKVSRVQQLFQRQGNEGLK